MIFNMSSGSGLNGSVVQYSDSSKLPQLAREGTIAVITNVEIPNYGYGKINPFTYYEDVELAQSVQWINGSISTSGAIGSQSANVEVYTDYYSVEYGKTYRYKHTLSVSNKAIWIGIVEYTKQGSTYTFKQRVDPFGTTGISGKDALSGYYTPSTSDVNAVRIVVKKYAAGNTATLSFIAEQCQKTKTSTKNGTVWIATADSGNISFNLLSNDSLFISPVKIEQYINDSWTLKQGWCYYQEEWCMLELVLHGNGHMETEWFAMGKHYASSGTTITVPEFSYNDDGALSSSFTASNHSGVLFCSDKIDLTNYDTLYFNGKITASAANYCRLCVWSEFGTYWPDNIVTSAINNIDGVVELDITHLRGEFFIGFGMRGPAEVIVNELILR